MTLARNKNEGKSTRTVWLMATLLGIVLAAALLVSGTWSAQASTLDQIQAQGRQTEMLREEPTGNKGVDAPQCDPDWAVVPSANAGASHNNLRQVTAISANDIWAVGTHIIADTIQTLILHWNGSVWSVVPSPNPGTADNFLYGVAAVSANDVWAVGDYSNNSGPWQILILHWNGSVWSVVPSPNVGTTYAYLEGIEVVSVNDVWAVGGYDNGSLEQTLAMHWDGSAWSVVPTPNPGTAENNLEALAVVSANDVWAVGRYENISSQSTALIEHWNGSEWSVVSSPAPGDYSTLQSVAVVSANDVWAVGRYTVGGTGRTLIVHWNGNNWNLVTSPSPSAELNSLADVTVVSANNVWAVGYYGGGGEAQTLVERWDGNTWSVVTSPSPSISYNNLSGVTAISANDVWAVGFQENASNVEQTLVERYNPCPGTPTPTSTPGGPTPTACPLQFTDVPAENTFYGNIRCLACKGIVSGYADGTFRPGNSVTRGQIAKIVSNAAGLAENHFTQSFEDIPTSHTFYLYIDRLASRGIIGGYACGGAGEPCGGGNMPYFRSSSNASRGQLAKIVCRAFGCAGTPSGQTFEDVPTSHTFYTEIEQVYALGAISGYACGGPGEPCGQGNRPYFRPGNNVSRGQTTKIVGNVFFPSCQTP